jgi:hypothetical protein
LGETSGDWFLVRIGFLILAQFWANSFAKPKAPEILLASPFHFPEQDLSIGFVQHKLVPIKFGTQLTKPTAPSSSLLETEAPAQARRSILLVGETESQKLCAPARIHTSHACPNLEHNLPFFCYAMEEWNCYKSNAHNPIPIIHQRKEEPAAMKTTSASAVFLLAMLEAQQLLVVQGDISCPEVVNDLTPCLSYLQGREASPSAACCGGAKALYGDADTRDERQQTCQCLKVAYHQYKVIVSAAQALPAACGLGLSYTITPDIDCSTWVALLRHTLVHKLVNFDK